MKFSEILFPLQFPDKIILLSLTVFNMWPNPRRGHYQDHDSPSSFRGGSFRARSRGCPAFARGGTGGRGLGRGGSHDRGHFSGRGCGRGQFEGQSSDKERFRKSGPRVKHESC